jgi:hypothetical protein
MIELILFHQQVRLLFTKHNSSNGKTKSYLCEAIMYLIFLVRVLPRKFTKSHHSQFWRKYNECSA